MQFKQFLATLSNDPRHSLAPSKTLADLFEAYVGALYKEHGWDTVAHHSL